MSSLELPEKIFGVDSAIVKVAALPIVLSLGMIISLIAVSGTKVSEIQSQLKKIDTLVAGRKQFESKKNYLSNVDQEAIARDSEYLNMALLKNKDAYVLVNVIRNVVTKYGYAVDSFSISPGEVATNESPVATENAKAKKKVKAKENDLVRIPVNMVMIGPKERYMEVLEALEKTLPLLSVDKMDFKAENSVGILTMAVSSYFSTDKTDIKLASVSINDLTLSKEESELIQNISQFNKIEGASAGDAGLIKDKSYTKYERENPFNF